MPVSNQESRPSADMSRKHTAGDHTVWPGHSGNWNRWDNDLGTMNLLSPQVVLRAAAAIQLGRVFPISFPLHRSDGATYFDEPAYVHEMVNVSEKGNEFMQDAGDRIAARQHGLLNTHLDALGHVGCRGQAFNGHAWEDVASRERLLRLDVTAHLGLVTRGVLIDVPRLRGTAGVTPGEAVQAGEIEPALAEVLPGDAVLVRLGTRWREDLAANAPAGGADDNGFTVKLPGLTTECVDLIAAHDVTALGTDCSADRLPADDPAFRGPIHMLTEVFYGMPLIHNLDLESLAAACHELGRNNFFFAASPVNLPGATGSLVSPIAIL
jgi:kynurenine formamidase